MIRLFVDHPLAPKMIVPLSEKSIHYLIHVMRCKDQDSILCFNGKDGEWRGILNMPTKKKIALELQEKTREQIKRPPCILCPALIKKDNMDLVLQKATELGATDIYPLLSDHTVHTHFNFSHAESILREAAEQSERLDIPHLHAPEKIAVVHKELASCTCCCLAERMDKLCALPSKGSIAFFVGPEGGWSPKEMAFFKQKNFTFFHSDVGILRAETASIGILAAWQFNIKK